MLYLSNGTFYNQLLNFHTDFMMTTRVFLLMRGTLGLLTVAILNIVLVKMLHEREENFALHVIRNLMCQIIKAEEEADAAHEFITNLPNDLVGKLVRESPNYLVYGNNIALNRESRRVVQEVGNSN
ncbi:hypothetical protein V1477_005759 [Vespula maculifrons]|uniref:Uncharacterized protein n=1 Tax=Vespula maculifrons TaxID=7453 RepID=A0ABD2CLX8_VESMC